MFNVGFTGTQQGITTAQSRTLECIFKIFKDHIRAFHHGDCIGADAQAHDIVREIQAGHIIVTHPPLNTTKQAFCEFDLCFEPQDYIKRNHDIVDCCSVLIATPKGYHEELRSGTWATIRYALKKKKTVLTVFPNGVVNITKGEKDSPLVKLLS